MKDEETKPPAAASKPPAKKPELSSNRPKTAAVTKGPSGPVIQDEDLGSGLSKEEAIDKVNEFFNPATVKKFEEAKWQTKQEAFNDLM